jgi:hypothetical protein
LGSGGWGVIEIDDAGADGDADGLPDRLDPYPANAANAFDLREAGAGRQFRHRRRRALHAAPDRLQRHRGIAADQRRHAGGGQLPFQCHADAPGPGRQRARWQRRRQRGRCVPALTSPSPRRLGYQIEHSGFGPQAPLLELTEDPAGSGLAIGRALGRLDPAYGSDYSDLDVWRIELEKGDRVSISVDSPASDALSAMWLYDAAGTCCF